MKSPQTAVVILVVLSASLALAEDFKTINGKEYKNATVTRTEPDGITIKFFGGLVKLPFSELPKEVQERFGYDPQKATAYSAEQNKEFEEGRKQEEKERQKKEADEKLKRSGERELSVPDIAQLKRRGFDQQTAQRIWKSCKVMADCKNTNWFRRHEGFTVPLILSTSDIRCEKEFRKAERDLEQLGLSEDVCR